MKTVAAADEVAGDLLGFAVVPEGDARRRPGDVVNGDVGGLEQDLSAIRKSARNKILDHLLLAVDGDALPDQLDEIDVVQRAVEAEVEPVVEQALALHPLADAGLDQQIARPVFDQAGADAAFDVGAAAVLQNDGIDALKMQEMRQHQPGRPGADDPHLRSHPSLPTWSPVCQIGEATASRKRHNREWLAHLSEAPKGRKI